MPLPLPKKGENRSAFLARAMHSGLKEEFPADKQAIAVAFSQWRKKHPGDKKK